MAVDYDKDLMVLVAKLPGMESTVKISAQKEVSPKTKLYSVVIAPIEGDKVMLFSKAGLVRKAFTRSDLSRRGQTYLQTNFPVGPGASGSPVFLEDSDLLVGVLGAQMGDGTLPLLIKATYLVRLEDIKRFLIQIAEDKNDSELDWPYCHGQEHICKVVLGEAPLVETFRHRYLEKDGKKGEQSKASDQNNRTDGVGEAEEPCSACHQQSHP